jgi:transcriptional adapter 2-alpha
LALPDPPAFDTTPVESCPSDSHEKFLQAKNKKERTQPAEFNGYMPFRHEFEVEYANEAETIACDVAFSMDDNMTTFESKCQALLAYNSQLEERRFRTAAIEELGIQYQDVKVGKTERDHELGFLNGISPIERCIDSKLVPLAPYYGADKLRPLAEVIHGGLRVLERIESRRTWQEIGIQTHEQGRLFRDLMAMVRDGRLPVAESENWNERLEQYQRSEQLVTQKANPFLNPAEMDLCREMRLDQQMYMALKNLLVREYMARGILKKQMVGFLCPKYADEIRSIYDLGCSQGWIT